MSSKVPAKANLGNTGSAWNQTNKEVQKTHGISQITASRDLAKLTILGLLLAHGKGRSVYYTRV